MISINLKEILFHSSSNLGPLWNLTMAEEAINYARKVHLEAFFFLEFFQSIWRPDFSPSTPKDPRRPANSETRLLESFFPRTSNGAGFLTRIFSRNKKKESRRTPYACVSGIHVAEGETGDRRIFPSETRERIFWISGLPPRNINRPPRIHNFFFFLSFDLFS